MTFGPVPSRRLGQSLGINNIPPEICSDTGVYHKLARTLTVEIERDGFHDPARIFEEVRAAGDPVNDLGFVPA